MVTNNQMGIRRKDIIIIVRVGRIIRIINPRTMVIMKRRIIILVRERDKGVR
jgi:hypothetical protein